MDKIVPEFSASLFAPEIKSSIIDMNEIGIDLLLEDGFLKQIPIVKILVGATKTILNIRERNFLKNTLLVIQNLNNGTIDLAKYEKYRKEINENPHKAEKELGRVIIILDRIIDNIKAVYVSKIFGAYINQKITWDDFCIFSEIIETLFTGDFATFRKVCEKKDLFEADEIDDGHDRLIYCGLMKNINRSGPFVIDLVNGRGKKEPRVSITPKGTLLGSLIFS